jgi:hypothetical protein
MNTAPLVLNRPGQRPVFLMLKRLKPVWHIADPRFLQIKTLLKKIGRLPAMRAKLS